MQGITSVSLGVEKPKRGGPIAVTVIGIVLALAGQTLIGLVAIVAGVFWWVTQKPTYHVLTRSASGETKALSGQDEQNAARRRVRPQ